MRLLTLALSIVIVHSLASAQDIVQCLGKPYNSVEITELISKLNAEKALESILPNAKIFKVDYLDDGISMEFDSRMALIKVTLYDSGHTFNGYRLPLPQNVEWQQSTDLIEKSSGKFIELDEDNPFKGKQMNSTHLTEYYFTDAQLSAMRITATGETLKATMNEVAKSYGFRLFPDGKVINGDVMAGTGTMVWGEKFGVYRGEWSYGLPHGKGEYTDSLGNRYQGEFKLGFFWGQGDFFSKQQQMSYSGQFVMGKRHGQGKSTMPSQVGYIGDWHQDLMHGNGVYVVGETFYYQGEMFKNTITGKGLLRTPSGTITGSFVNGKPHGVCEQRTTDDTQGLKGQWVNGSKEGEFVLSTPAGEKRITYHNDVEVSRAD